MILDAEINPTTSTLIASWLAGSDKRFIIVCADLTGYNTNILTALGVGTRSFTTTGAIPSNPYLIQVNNNTTYFTTAGPFTPTDTPVSSNLAYRKYDVFHSEIGISTNSRFTPILARSGGGIVLGVNISNRILFVGDVNIFDASDATGVITDYHLTNTTGTINNSASRLIANVCAYIAQTVFAK